MKHSTRGQIEYLLARFTDHVAFERLCSALLLREPDFRALIPRGGTHDKGADAVLTGKRGICYFQYSLQKRWDRKLQKELDRVFRSHSPPTSYVFVTNQRVGNVRRTRTEDRCAKQFGARLLILDFSWLYSRLVTADNSAIREEFFGSLQHDLFDWGKYLHQAGEHLLHTQELSKLYIASTAHEPGCTASFDLAEYCETFLRCSSSKFLAVLGDFGTGKTTFCLMFLDRQLRDNRESTAKPPVLLIEMKNYRQALGLAEYVQSEVARTHGIRPSVLELEKVLCDSSSLLLLDGLDEMSKVGIHDNPRDELRANLETIVSGSRGCKIILTSRKEYLRDDPTERMLRTAGFQVVYLEPWTDDDVIEFLERCNKAGLVDENVEDMWHKIQESFDLPDILKRPLFANMFVRYGDFDEIQRGQALVKIYESYLNEWMTYQANFRARSLQLEDIRFFVEQLASQMALKNEVSVLASDVEQAVETSFSRKYGGSVSLKKFSAARDVLSMDIRTNTVLNRKKNRFVFAHKSFMEYFAAKRMITDIVHGDSAYLGKVRCTPDLMYFLSQLYCEYVASADPLHSLIMDDTEGPALALCLELRLRVCERAPMLASQFNSIFVTEATSFHQVARRNIDCVMIPGGSFIFGSNEASTDIPPVRLETDPFQISKYPVTNAQFESFLRETSYEPMSGICRQYYKRQAREQPMWPVVLVTWADASAFAEWYGGRLPTEVEWEKAARGCFGRRWPWGDLLDENLVNSGRSDRLIAVNAPKQKASPFGVIGMSGNVWEWTSTEFTIKRGGAGVAQGIRHFIIKGGAWSDPIERARCAARQEELEVNAYDCLGFRIVKDADAPSCPDVTDDSLEQIAPPHSRNA
jgi:formylglycine-generating enzyme required for sulfatase activity